MPQFRITHEMPHSAAEMFDLVADIESYPAFVPLCQRLKVRGREERDGVTVLVADMTVSYAMFRETFSTRVLLDRAAMTIKVEYLSGPFRHLENIWRFEPAGPGASVIDFFIAYEFHSRTLATLMATVFDRAFRRTVGAFEARADAVYGRKTPAKA